MLGKAIMLAMGAVACLPAAPATAREPVRLAEGANPAAADAQQPPVSAEPQQTSRELWRLGRAV